jgi:hypothetical protein
MRRLTAQLANQQTEARRLDAAIEANLETLGYTIQRIDAISLMVVGLICTSENSDEARIDGTV